MSSISLENTSGEEYANQEIIPFSIKNTSLENQRVRAANKIRNLKEQIK